MIKRSLELSPGNDGNFNFNDKTGSRNGQGGNTGGGQGVPGVIAAGNLRNSGKKITAGGKSREKESSKVRKPLLSFSKKKKEEKMNESTVEPCDGIREQSNSGGAGRSCSLDTFPSTTGCPTSSTANKKMVVSGSSSLLTYSHVDIHTSDEHGKISAI